MVSISRRQFLGWAVVGTAALALPLPKVATPYASTPAKPYVLSTYNDLCLYIQNTYPWANSVEILARRENFGHIIRFYVEKPNKNKVMFAGSIKPEPYDIKFVDFLMNSFKQHGKRKGIL